MTKNWKNPLALLFILVLSSSSFSQQNLPKLFINEFLASNSKINISPDFREYADWLEIYNAGDSTVDLSGYSLTDDLSEPGKWTIPAKTTIAPRSHLLIWADDRNQGLHANFKLSADGEAIGLFRGRDAIDTLTFPPQAPDVSSGRYPDGAGNWLLYSKPTPGAANSPSGFLDQASAPGFSPGGGFYHGSQSIALDSAFPDEVIRFTRDGSLPNDSSPVYASPIRIDSTTVIRAQAQRSGRLASAVVTQTFFIDETTTLPVVSVATGPANLWDDKTGIYVIGTNGVAGYCSSQPRNWNQPWEKPVSLEMYEANAQFGFKLDAGMQIGGGCTRLYPQKPLAIYTRSEYGTSSIEYPVFADKPITSYNNVLLRNSGQDWWRAMCRDGVIQTIVKGRMDIDWQAYKPAVLFLNGAYWGIHDIREKHNEHYLESNYGIDPDKIDILSSNAAVEQGSAALYKDLIRFIETHNMALAENFAWVKSQMDVNEYLNYQITEIYFANIDWPGGNIKYWRQQGENHKWRWILFDTDLGLGAHDYGQYFSNSLENATSPVETYYANPAWSTFLLRKLLENAEFRSEFIQRFASHMNLTFNPLRAVHIIDSLTAHIGAEIPRHIAKWPQSTARNGNWSYHVNVMREFAAKRPEHVRNHLIAKFGLSGTAQLTVNNPSPEGGDLYIAGVRLPETDFSGAFFKEVPIRCQAVPRHGYRFSGWQGPASTAQDSVSIVLAADDTLTALFEPEEARVFAGLKINEIMALNSKSKADEQGEYDDWIELYNDSQAPVNIGGMYLTDNLSRLDMWQIPAGSAEATTIPPGGFLLLWADNTPAQGALHLNIKLSGDGEEVGISKRTDQGLTLIDKIIFGGQQTDVSYGRSPDGKELLAFFSKSTPGHANTPTGISQKRAMLPENARLKQNYPNPFNAATAISYTLTADSPVRLAIYDAAGREIRVLVNQRQAAGEHSARFDAGDLASGIYLCRLVTESSSQSRKMLLLR